MTHTEQSLTAVLVHAGVARRLHTAIGPLFEAAAPLAQAGRPGEPLHPSTPCLIWRGTLFPNGYGLVHMGVNRRVHLVTRELTQQPIPVGLEAGHLCERRACGRPDHTQALTHAANVRQSAARRFPDSLLALAAGRACPVCGGTMAVSVNISSNLAAMPRWRWSCGSCHAGYVRRRVQKRRHPEVDLGWHGRLSGRMTPTEIQAVQRFLARSEADRSPTLHSGEDTKVETQRAGARAYPREQRPSTLRRLIGGGES